MRIAGILGIRTGKAFLLHETKTDDSIDFFSREQGSNREIAEVLTWFVLYTCRAAAGCKA
jgi:hypothetical protein